MKRERNVPLLTAELTLSRGTSLTLLSPADMLLPSCAPRALFSNVPAFFVFSQLVPLSLSVSGAASAWRHRSWPPLLEGSGDAANAPTAFASQARV